MSDSTAPANTCPQCGVALPSTATAGLCPRCLLAEAMVPTQTDAGPADARPTLAPEELAPYFPQLEILACLGRGGMGVVYQARQKTLNRFVALKLLAPERVGDAQFAERFTREAQALAALNHPNIVTIYDFGQAGGFYYLLMEFVDGVNLRELLRARKLTPEEALTIVPPLCDALQFAHNRGIIHRDIKPENLLLDKDGRVKVADFGIAKMLGAANPGSQAGEPAAPENVTHATVGTPAYSAPEQKTDPQHVDSRADIYSLGVVFYEMLTGELPGKRIEPPSRKVQIDVKLDEIVLRALERKPEFRYQQASQLKTQIETLVQPGAAPAPPPQPPVKNMSPKLKENVVIALVVLFIILCGMVIWLHPWKHSRPVAMWSGDNNGADSVGGLHAELTDITYGDGPAGRAFVFNGSSSTIKIPASTTTDLGLASGFTIMAWIKPDDVDGLHPLLQWSDDFMLNLWIGIEPFQNGVLRGDVGEINRNHFVCSNPDVLMKGVFQHIAFTYDKASGNGALYVNGIQVAQRRLGTNLVARTTGDIWFSQRDDRPGNWSTGRMFSGMMDRIALYNHALSGSEIKSICHRQNHGEPLAEPAPSTGWFEPRMR